MRSTDTQPADDTVSIALIEETAQIEKHKSITGRVAIQTFVDEFEEVIRTTLEETHVKVVRVPVNRAVDKAPPIRTEGDVTIIPVLEEVLFIEKRLMLKEELHITRRTGLDNVEVPVTLRKQRATIERLDPNTVSTTHEEN